MSDLQQQATQARLKVLDLIYSAQTSHIGSCFSAIDIMAVLFDRADIIKDEVVLSAGWKAAAWYYFLWKKGIITEEELNSFCKEGSPFIGLVEPMNRWGLKLGTGSMGLGLPAAVGLALAKKLKGEDGKVYVLMSDGELQCGTTWESILIAGKEKLNNLVVIVDDNGCQAMGKTIFDIFGDSLTGFGRLGWKYIMTDGHDFKKMERHIIKQESAGQSIGIEWQTGEKPYLVFAKTVKGKGIKRFEGNNLYHYKQLSEEEYLEAKKELNG